MPQTRRQAKYPKEKHAEPVPKADKHKTIRKVPLGPSQLRAFLQTQKFSQKHHQVPARSRSFPHPPSEHLLSSVISLEKLNCPICLQPLISPTLTECGHAFCLSCAEESLRHKSTCAICRKTICFEEFHSSPDLEKIVTHKVGESGSLEAQTLYQSRVQTFEEQETKRRISADLKEGDLVDYWKNRKWREGKVVSVDITPSGTVYKIQPTQEFAYEGNLAVCLGVRSRLLAKHRAFTQDERSFNNRTQFRIEIFDFQDNAEQSLFLSMMEGGRRRMELSFREDDGDDFFIRFALSFERREQ